MSSLLRRMQRIASRGQRAKKAAINRQFATRLGPPGDRAAEASLLKRGRKPRALRRSKKSQASLVKRAADRKAKA